MFYTADDRCAGPLSADLSQIHKDAQHINSDSKVAAHLLSAYVLLEGSPMYSWL